MQSERNYKLTSILFILTAALLTMMHPKNSFGEMSAEIYCQLTAELIEQQISNYEQLIHISESRTVPRAHKEPKGPYSSRLMSHFSLYSAQPPENMPCT